MDGWTDGQIDRQIVPCRQKQSESTSEMNLVMPAVMPRLLHHFKSETHYSKQLWTSHLYYKIFKIKTKNYLKYSE